MAKARLYLLCLFTLVCGADVILSKQWHLWALQVQIIFNISSTHLSLFINIVLEMSFILIEYTLITNRPYH